MFAYLHGGQIEPPGNYLRYLAPFIFVIYPALAYLINLGINLVTRSQVTRMILLGLIVGTIATTQTRTTFRFVNDPAADGLDVGRRILALRQEHPDLSQLPVLIEVSYWQYLAIHIGANDISRLAYDRQLDPMQRRSLSFLLTDVDTVRNCLAFYHFSYIVVKSPELQVIVESNLKLLPSERINSYVFYRVPTDLMEGNTTSQEPCLQSFGY